MTDLPETVALTEPQKSFLAGAWRRTHLWETRGKPAIFPRGSQHRVVRRLCALGLMRFWGWGRDIDGEVDGDVPLYEPTDLGVRVAIALGLIDPVEEAATAAWWGLRALHGGLS